MGCRNAQLARLQDNVNTAAALHKQLMQQLADVSSNVYVSTKVGGPDKQCSWTKPGLFTGFVTVYASPRDAEPFGFLCPVNSNEPSEGTATKLGLPDWFRIPRWAKGDTLSYFESLKAGTSDTYGRMCDGKMCLTTPPPVASLRTPLVNKNEDKTFRSNTLFETVKDCLEELWVLPFNDMNEYSSVLEQLATTFLGAIKTLSD